ncbi:putative membrane protein [Sphingomonas sp. BE270]|jgi:putative membrane protein|uniref:CopD family protein n=1 Tax=unclassified Sphingomonas TaxID=196159 RepID=UPI001484EA9F|nr:MULTISPECIES: CopD family protein [unclassified Sphingomonas]MDR6848241.1 putative membrane protein [Sphingomonas sp. BE137]MDR7258903.1 putative membrane protein [Sphingomonas sp. BE270]
MIGMLGNAYLWVKAAHVIFVVFWMAGMFMLPRYLVYHQEALTSGGSSSPEALLWVERERKIRNIILTPSMIMVWILGLALAANVGLFSGQHGLGWLHLKLALVLVLSGYHGWAVGYARKLAAGKPTLTGRQLRLINEVPAVLVTFIVILVIVQPF